jgi:C1A family cysteine protease
MKYFLGYTPDVKDRRDFTYKKAFRTVSTPALVDYTDEMNPIRNQGAKGSCVAFAFAAIKEWQEFYQRGFTEQWDMSEQFLYEHIQLHPGGGAYPREALKVLHDIGIPLEKQYPYKRGSDKNKLVPPEKKIGNLRMFNTARRFRAKGYARIRNVEELMQSLTVNGPCFIGTEWLDGWYDKTILQAQDGRVSGGHAITAVGFDREEGLIKIRNQWGEHWGDEGYGWMTFEAFEEHAIDCWAIFDMGHPLVR